MYPKNEETRSRGVKATEKGIAKLKNAKANQCNDNGRPLTYADIADMSRLDEKTVRRFIYEEKAVDENSAIAICQALDVDTKEVIDSKSRYKKDRNGQLDKKKSAFSIVGSFEKNKINVAKIRAVEASLKELSGDVDLKIVDIEEGSIKLTLEGSQEGLERLEQLFKSGELAEVLNIPVEDVRFVDSETFKDNKKRLTFTIAGNTTHVDIKNLKAAFTKISNQENTENYNKSRLIQNILENGASGQDLSSADLRYANLCGADLRGADLNYADLRRADLRRADLRRADLRRANLRGADLRGANLRGADLRGVYLSDTIIDIETKLDHKWHLVWEIVNQQYKKQSLKGADLSGANLRRADLRGVDLRLADLRGADLRGANLRGADLRGVYLSDTIIDIETKLDHKWHLVWEIVNQQYKKQSLKGADLSGANLRGADLGGVDLRLADLRGADLRGANVEKSLFGDNTGISVKIRFDLIKRGAIFEDFPGVRFAIYSPTPSRR